MPREAEPPDTRSTVRPALDAEHRQVGPHATGSRGQWWVTDCACGWGSALHGSQKGAVDAWAEHRRREAERGS